MNKRDSIKEDAMFWLRLEREACRELTSREEWRRGGYWIDGFAPESVHNTQYGVEVEGIVWVVEGKGAQHPFRFRVGVPQRMLHRRREHFTVEDLVLDAERENLCLNVCSPRKVAA